MILLISILSSCIGISISLPHYKAFPLYHHRPIWIPQHPTLAKHLIEGAYNLKQNPYDGRRTVLAAYNVSENAIKIIRESVDVVEITCDGDGEITFSRLPGVEVARVPKKVSVRSRAWEVVDYVNPITGEEAQFSWHPTSPVSLVTTVRGKQSRFVEIRSWAFNTYGAQVSWFLLLLLQVMFN